MVCFAEKELLGATLAAKVILGDGTLSKMPAVDSTDRPPFVNVGFEQWEDYTWKSLPFNIRQHWEVLGWDEDSWGGESDVPLSESKVWDELTALERTAAFSLGYTSDTWSLSADSTGSRCLWR